MFFDFVISVQNVFSRRRGVLNVFAASLLFLMKVAKNYSFEALQTFFSLKQRRTSSRIFMTMNLYYYTSRVPIPRILDVNGAIIQSEVVQFYASAYNDAQTFYRELFKDFQDPRGLNRIPVPIATDATYLDTTSSSDLQHQKYTYYDPRSGHTVKCILFTSMRGKILTILPLASSQSPSSGDSYLMATFGHLSLFLRAILRGTNQYFGVVIVDSGLVHQARNQPSQSRNLPTFEEMCTHEGSVLLHTSDTMSVYHLARNSANKVHKVPRNDDLITHSENVVGLTREARKSNEQTHAGLKQGYKILNVKKMATTYLLPLNQRLLAKYQLDGRYHNVPKLAYIAVVCASLYNKYHPGFPLGFMDDNQQRRMAAITWTRMWAENPLQYEDLFPINLRGRDRLWSQVTLAQLAQNDILNFPKLANQEINPIAVEMCGGLHALTSSNSVLTYFHQKELEGRGMDRQQLLNEVQNLPGFMTFDYFRMNTRPDDWSEEKFGPWYPVTLVRTSIPPSNRSATRANYHHPVIGFGTVPSERLGMQNPYRVIYFWRCMNCPSKNGLISCCKHLAALLKVLSFPQNYRSTARGIDLLNTVADNSRQVTQILPPNRTSLQLPRNVLRKSIRNRRAYIGGQLNPLYDTNVSGNPVSVTQPSISLGPSTQQGLVAGPVPTTATQLLPPSTRIRPSFSSPTTTSSTAPSSSASSSRSSSNPQIQPAAPRGQVSGCLVYKYPSTLYSYLF